MSSCISLRLNIWIGDTWKCRRFFLFFSWFIKLLGGGEFWIKFFPDFVGGLCYLLIGKMVLHLKGGKFALLLAFLPFIFGAYLRVFFLFQPNFIEIFFWTLIAYSMLRYLQTNRNGWLYVFGTAIGLGLMSKYTVAFFTLSLLGGLLISANRRIFSEQTFICCRCNRTFDFSAKSVLAVQSQLSGDCPYE